MADSILKLRVESSEYDAKLKKAAEGIRHLADVAHQSGGELTGLEQSELEYIRALGEMETKSRTAAGQSRELANAYKEMKVIYDQLNDVEKADEGGKALAASLEQIKQRAQDAKSQLDAASRSLEENSESGKEDSSVLSQLASKFVINIDAIKLFNVGLQASKIALDVAKDAFFASEANVDEWGRTVAASESLYNSFLTALNTGDISGYLSNIDSIVQAARAAYNELDRLGTMKTIQTPKMSAQQTENDRFRMMLQTGRYIAPVDGRKASMEDGTKLTKEQLKTIERQLQNGMKTVTSLIANEVKQTGKAIDALYNRQSKELGMGIKEFRKGTSSMEEFDKRMAGYDKYQQWRSEHTTIDLQSGRETVARGNPYQQFASWGAFRVDGDRYKNIVQLIQQRDQQSAQAYSTQGQMYRTMNRVDNKLTPSGGAGKGGTAVQTELQQNQKKVNDLQQQYVDIASKGVSIDDERLVKLREEIDLLNKRNEQLKFYAENAQGRLLPRNLGTDTTGISQIPGGGVVPIAQSLKTDFKIDEKSLRKVQKSIEKQADEQIKQDSKDTKSVADGVGMLSNGMTSFAKGLDALGIDLGEGFDSVISGIMAVTSILSGISTILIAIEAIAGADAIIPLAHGGIVPHAAGGYMIGGNSFSGDNIFAGGAWVNSGELVLNKSQQSTLASRLNDGGITNIKLSAVVRGNQLLLVQNNDSRISGKGTIMRTNSKH